MTKPDSVERGWEWGGLRPPGAKSTRFIEIPRVFSPGNERTFAGVTLEPKGLVVLPSLANPSKKKSPEVTVLSGLQGKPLMETEELKSATQKSCNGSGSDARQGRMRKRNIIGQKTDGKIEHKVVAMAWSGKEMEANPVLYTGFFQRISWPFGRLVKP